ncbi:hypothetical protein LTR64_000937 [Lithohypha guttulata]|uniref:uncharacterized protein n=1 Tax=Lithohypha guttulata TaxID=1690604 RepID=UPI002DE08877|nr:hypothetical protein LTR51_003131 [Lithohypha guttulata]
MAGLVLSDAATQEGAKKLRRITRACDYCHRRSIRCRFPGQEDNNRCQNCVDFDQPCLFERVVKRRGAKPRSQTLTSDRGSPESIKQEYVYGDICRTPSIVNPVPWQEWKAPRIVSQATVMDLMKIYLEIVYPVFPIFHRATLIRRVAKAEYLTNKYSFAAVMSICAIVTARLADRAAYNPCWDVQELTKVKSEVFYAAAVKECGNAGALDRTHFDLLRTCACLALTAIQYSKFREFETHMGKYHCLVAMDGLHDEANWPKNIGIVETEERRRLFWTVYCLDIYSSVSRNGVIRSREQQSNVAYTTELDDDYFDDTGYRTDAPSSGLSSNNATSSHSHSLVAADAGSSSWLCGWNFINDLYRVMEHVITNFRDKGRQKRSFVSDVFGEASAVPASNVRDSIMNMYNNLPQCFKETQPMTLDQTRDRYGYQAASITATVQLLRMILFSSAGATIEDRCNVASEVVDAFMRIPVQYLQAMSSPLVHHLAAIGSILGSVCYEPLSESSHLQVRIVLLALAQLLENLDHGIHSTACAEKLRKLVIRVDERMENQRHGINGPIAQFHENSGSAGSPHPFSRSSSGDKSDGSNSMSTGSAPSIDGVFPPSNEIFDDWPWNHDYMHLPES